MSFVYENSNGQLVDWPKHAFGATDLAVLDLFLKDKEVVPLNIFSVGLDLPNSVAMRHDVDHSIEWAYKFAQWEHARGYKSTYFILHTAWYYKQQFEQTMQLCQEIKALGHEIGIHNDAISTAVVMGGQNLINDAAILFQRYIDEMNNWDLNVVGCADHGAGHGDLLNEFWDEYMPSDFGLEYEAYQLSRGENYISDNQGRWRAPLQVVEGKDTHVLIHPCHWDVS